MSKTRQWALITGLVFVVILAAGWFLLVKPEKSKVANLKDQAQQQLASNQLLLTQIESLQAEQSQLTGQQLLEDKFSIEVPDTAAEPTLIRQLSATANGSGVDLTTITPGAPTALAAPAAATGSQSLGSASPTGGGLYSLPLTLNISGSYSNIESFFNGLERLPRALLVTAFTMNPGSSSTTTTTGSTASSGGGTVLTASLTASVFFAPGTAPLTVPTPPAAAGASTPGATPAPGATTTPGAVSSLPPNPAEIS